MYDTRIVAYPCEQIAGLQDFHGSSVRCYTTLEMTLKGHLKISMIITPPKINDITLQNNNVDNFRLLWIKCAALHNLEDDLEGASQGGGYKPSW